MPRRWRGRHTDPAEQRALSLAAANLKLCAQLDEATDARRLLLRDVETLHEKRDGDRKQLAFLRTELTTAQTDRAAETVRADRAERRAEALAEALKREQEHVAGSCSHAADLKAMHAQVGALEQRVHELQQANMGRDVPEIIGWGPALTAGPVRRALKRGQG